MSRRIAVDQNVCRWDGGHPGLTVWNLLNYTRIENERKVRKKTVVILCNCYMYNYWKDRTVTGLFESLWLIRPNCQLLMKFEMIHMFQPQTCDCISTKNETWNQRYIVKSAKSGKLKWVVLNFGSENQLNVHNYVQCWCNWTQPINTRFFKPHLEKQKKTQKNSTIYFSCENLLWSKT